MKLNIAIVLFAGLMFVHANGEDVKFLSLADLPDDLLVINQDEDNDVIVDNVIMSQSEAKVYIKTIETGMRKRGILCIPTMRYSSSVHDFFLDIKKLAIATNVNLFLKQVTGKFIPDSSQVIWLVKENQDENQGIALKWPLSENGLRRDRSKGVSGKKKKP